MARSTYDKLLLAGYHRFCREGPRALVIADIAADAGMTKGAFYKTGFPATKVRLVQDILAYGNSRMLTYREEVLACKTVAQFKKVLLTHEDTGKYAGKVMMLPKRLAYIESKNRFDEIFGNGVEHLATLFAQNEKEKEILYDLVPMASRDLLLNVEENSWKYQVNKYLRILDRRKK